VRCCCSGGGGGGVLFVGPRATGAERVVGRTFIKRVTGPFRPISSSRLTTSRTHARTQSVARLKQYFVSTHTISWKTQFDSFLTVALHTIFYILEYSTVLQCACSIERSKVQNRTSRNIAKRFLKNRPFRSRSFRPTRRQRTTIL